MSPSGGQNGGRPKDECRDCVRMLRSRWGGGCRWERSSWAARGVTSDGRCPRNPVEGFRLVQSGNDRIGCLDNPPGSRCVKPFPNKNRQLSPSGRLQTSPNPSSQLSHSSSSIQVKRSVGRAYEYVLSEQTNIVGKHGQLRIMHNNAFIMPEFQCGNKILFRWWTRRGVAVEEDQGKKRGGGEAVQWLCGLRQHSESFLKSVRA
ncbi:hypothetical protein GWI33_017596 [Rhynchophorus ferrugineus]|uniref:Uncharacterized protein n=1 Tax=Rhynchophorus ferrugineus TaxID=354439 RepID=A0A834M611_RHYFE|nr:hypothetical protein GWI33_017596 [Rhynchophorus ferrugineus]